MKQLSLTDARAGLSALMAEMMIRGRGPSPLVIRPREQKGGVPFTEIMSQPTSLNCTASASAFLKF